MGHSLLTSTACVIFGDAFGQYRLVRLDHFVWKLTKWPWSGLARAMRCRVGVARLLSTLRCNTKYLTS